MKTRIPIIALSSFLLLVTWCLSSCQRDQRNESISTESMTPESSDDEALNATGFPIQMQLPFLYTYESDSTKIGIDRNLYYKGENLHMDTLIKAFNVHYPDIFLKFDRFKGDTLLLTIDDAMYLTQQMGSEGATAYIAEVVYAFTELPRVHVVGLQFHEGDHAVPGFYTRHRIQGAYSKP